MVDFDLISITALGRPGRSIIISISKKEKTTGVTKLNDSLKHTLYLSCKYKVYLTDVVFD